MLFRSVGHLLHLGEGVGGQEHGAALRDDLPQHLVELVLHERIETGVGLVHDDQLGFVYQCGDQPHLLTVPRGQLPDALVEVRVESLPQPAKEKPLEGEVVAVGNGTKDEEMILKVGDQVLYGKYAGTEIEYEGAKYLIMRQSDVVAVLG